MTIPVALSGSTAGAAGNSGYSAQVITSPIPSRTRTGVLPAPNTGASINMPEMRNSGQK